MKVESMSKFIQILLLKSCCLLCAKLAACIIIVCAMYVQAA